MSEAKLKLESTTGYKQKIFIANTTFILDTDAHKESGGEYSAPAPYDFLLSSLAACTSMTMQIYANRKKMSLERVELEMEIRKEEDPTTLQKVDVVYKKIFLFGNLSAADREKLLEIAGKCPVNKTLQNGIKSVAVLG